MHPKYQQDRVEAVMLEVVGERNHSHSHSRDGIVELAPAALRAVALLCG